MKKITLITLSLTLLVAAIWWKMDSSNTAFRIGINIDKKQPENSRGIAGSGEKLPRQNLTKRQAELLKQQAIEKFRKNSKDQVMDHSKSFQKEKKN